MEMSGVADANNAVARLIQAGQWAEAERELGEIEQFFQLRRPVDIRLPPRQLDLAAAMDEFYAAAHRILIGWHHESYAETLPYAERAWVLEKAIFAAGRTRREGKERFATSIGAWGFVSFLSSCERFKEAAAVFEEAIDDRDWFWACFGDKADDCTAKTDLLLAGIEVYVQSQDPALIARGRETVAFAQDHRTVASVFLLHALARFWCMTNWNVTDDRDRAFAAIEQALRRGYEPKRFLTDPALAPLHGDPRWQCTLVPEPLARATYRVMDEPGDYFTLMAWAPDEAARAKTRAFLGDYRGAWIRFEFGATMLAGPGTLDVLGNGQVMLRRFPRYLDESESLTVQFQPRDVERLFETFVQEAFTEMSLPKVAFVRPGAPRLQLELGNSGGEKYCVEKWGHMGNEGFDRLLDIVQKVTSDYLTPDQFDDFLAPFGRRGAP